MNALWIVLIIAFIILTIILVNCVAVLQNNKKFRKRIEEQFGVPPEQIDDPEYPSISVPWKAIERNEHDAPFIDQTTWNDLDMDEVFARINACQTSIGEEHLYSVLHQPKFTQEELQKRETIIEIFKQNPEIRIEIQVWLAKLGKENYNGLYTFINEADVKGLKHTALYRILSYLPLACLTIIPFQTLIGIGCVIVSLALNIIAYFIAKRQIQQETAAIQYFTSMLWCCGKICKMKDEGLKDIQKEFQENYCYFKSMSSKVSGTMRRRMTVSDLDIFVEYFRILSLSDIKGYNKIVNYIIKYRENCVNIYRIIGELDMLISVSSFRESLPFYTYPHFISRNQVNVREIYHPLLSHPVPNTVTISNDSIITGSNASGKSTFIKALAINGILAQTIHTCTAKIYQTQYALIITSMAVRDNIMAGDSYFVTELKSLKRVLDKVENTSCICFIDEILKGTNTIERIAASASISKVPASKKLLMHGSFP